LPNISVISKFIRIHQWVKNMILFLPVFFGGRFFDKPLLLNTLFTFIGFSFIASAVYVFNDIRDIAHDRLHPEKRNRPLAAGLLSVNLAWGIFCFLLVVGVAIFLFLINKPAIWLAVGLYLSMNVVYSMWLKHVAIIDVVILSVGFLVRIYLGSAATGVELSHWIIIMTFLGALFLAFAKRRDDVLLLNSTGIKARSNLDGYNLEFVNAAIVLTGAVVVVAYIMYTTSTEIVANNGRWVFTTTFFVIIGVLRYLQITLVDQKSGNPTRVFLQDKFLIINTLAWIAAFSIILYWH
jgi:decaprenyl-phosphate phosphoribosyltransferase